MARPDVNRPSSSSETLLASSFGMLPFSNMIPCLEGSLSEQQAFRSPRMDAKLVVDLAVRHRNEASTTAAAAVYVHVQPERSSGSRRRRSMARPLDFNLDCSQIAKELVAAQAGGEARLAATCHWATIVVPSAPGPAPPRASFTIGRSPYEVVQNPSPWDPAEYAQGVPPSRVVPSYYHDVSRRQVVSGSFKHQRRHIS